MLEVKGISKRFGDLQVVEDVSFTVHDGEILAILGPSGCGKSTVLNIISALESADAGTVTGAQDSVSYVFQDDRLLPWRTVYDNIRLVRPEEDKVAINELIQLVGLDGFAKYYPSQLSGGMKKRCGLARAFYYPAKLLIMDEAFQGLDYCLRHDMLDILLQMWQKQQQSILFITHEIDEALTIATRILVFSKRPCQVRKEFILPQGRDRDLSSPALNAIRREVIALIT